MPATPAEIEDVLNQMREVLLEWHKRDTLGEVAVMRGGQDWLVEERPIRRRAKVKREHRREGYLEKVAQA